MRFHGLFLCYVLFLILFTVWTMAETREVVAGSARSTDPDMVQRTWDLMMEGEKRCRHRQ